MFGLGKPKGEEPKDAPPPGALDNWAWDPVKDDYVLKAGALPEEAQEAIRAAGGVPPSELSADDFVRLYPPDTFRDNVAGIIGFFGGSLAKLETCEIDPNTDVAFGKAMEVAYRRLVANDNGLVLRWLSSRDLVDLIVVTAWVGPFAKAVAAEAKAKKRKKALAQQQRPGQAEDRPGVVVQKVERTDDKS